MIARPEFLRSCRKLRPGKQPSGLMSGQLEGEAVKGSAGKPGAENKNPRFDDQPVKITVA
ncbi:hypothetical protein [Sunxiuqinia dokdonensis]|uniref:hypothetical protein n=1 Tax=Sunxiuqinia dokdonensis TaxID=1409788 RepID=UPI00069D0D11|nr:hypothetical protein [Sunxiuqinia dokdonensis]